MIARFLVWLLGVTMVAGIIHIVVVLGVPKLADAPPWDIIGRFGTDGAFVALPKPEAGKPALPGLDPAMAQAACRFDLGEAPVRIKATPPDVYWSVSLYDRAGLHVWGFDNRSVGQKALDILIADEGQVAQIRENPPEEFEELTIVDWKGTRGIAVLQVYRETPSLDGEIYASLAAAECRKAPLP